MSGDYSRIERVASTVTRALAGPVGELAREHRAGLVTITGVDLSPDLRRGVVWLSVYGEEEARAAFIGVLREHAGSLQSALGRALRTRRTPVMSFRLDDAPERSDRIDRLLKDGPAEAER